MPKLPWRITPDPTCAFYLRPRGSAGSEAIVYLPAFNHAMRDKYTGKGYWLLSEVGGDFSDKSAPLRVQPPREEMVRNMLVELDSRIMADGESITEQIEQCKEKMEDTEARERGIYRLRLKGLEREFKSLGTHVPTFEQAMSFFVRVHRAQLKAKISPAIVQQQAVMAEDQEWAGLQRVLDGQIREAIITAEPSAKPKKEAEPEPATV
jgi:hypothetical protein